MGVPSGANSRPPCASKLCGPVPKYEFPEEGGFSGLISFSAHSLKRILRPLGLGLPCVGWYKASRSVKGKILNSTFWQNLIFWKAKILVPLGAPKTMAQESDLSGIN